MTATAKARAQVDSYQVKLKDAEAEKTRSEKVIKKLEARALRGSERAVQILLEFAFGRPKTSEDVSVDFKTTYGEVDLTRLRQQAEETLKKMIG